MISFGSVPAASNTSTKAASRRVFLSASVPDDTGTSIISIFSGRGLGKTRIVEIDFQVGLLKTEKALEHVVVGTSRLDACFMYGTRDRILFVRGSARFHRHGEQCPECLP